MKVASTGPTPMDASMNSSPLDTSISLTVAVAVTSFPLSLESVCTLSETSSHVSSCPNH